MDYMVKLLKDDPRFKLNKDDVLLVKTYSIDPSKVIVIRRVSDHFDPMCTQYKSDIERIKQSKKD